VSWIAPLAVLVASFALLAVLLWRGRYEREVARRALAPIAALEPAEARRRAEVLLADPALFRCVEARAEPPQLPEAVAGLLARYDSVETRSTPQQRIARDLIATLDGSGDIAVGEGMVASDTPFRLIARGRAILEQHAGEAVDPVWGTFPTVWHWVLAAALRD